METKPMIQKIATKNSPSGNPRRGWVVHFKGNTAFVDEGYDGHKFYSQVICLNNNIIIEVKPSEYFRLKKVLPRISNDSDSFKNWLKLNEA